MSADDSSFRTQAVPLHVAIIMDGNGRWAQARGLPRSMGHRQGAEAARKAVRAAAAIGIRYLTLFGFSTENWSRPAEEVGELMRLLRMFLRSETAEMHRGGIRLRVIGDRERLAPDIVELIENAEGLTAGNEKMTVIIALDYGGRADIIQAASRWALMCREKNISPDAACAEEYLPGFFAIGDIPDPDILIRTSGEKRISNFMLWQCAYSEFVFTDTFWPDFGEADLRAAIGEFHKRERRFGAVAGSERG